MAAFTATRRFSLLGTLSVSAVAPATLTVPLAPAQAQYLGFGFGPFGTGLAPLILITIILQLIIIHRRVTHITTIAEATIRITITQTTIPDIIRAITPATTIKDTGNGSTAVDPSRDGQRPLGPLSAATITAAEAAIVRLCHRSTVGQRGPHSVSDSRPC